MTMQKREKIIATMRQLVADGTWTALDGNTIRWSEELDTPAWAREKRPLIGASWPDTRYTRYVFVTIYRTGKPMVGVSRAPWVQRTDSYTTLTRVGAILENPRSVFV